MRDALPMRYHARVGVAKILIGLALPLIAAVALSACLFGGESDPDYSKYFDEVKQQSPATEDGDSEPSTEGGSSSVADFVPAARDLEDLEVAPPSARFAVQSFFHLLERGELQSAYQRTSAETRERISAEDFAQRYRDIWAEATIGGFRWDVTPQEDEDASSHEVVIRYQTTFYGEIEEIVNAPTLRQPHWVVDWTPDLMFSGLGPSGYLIRSSIETPTRGLILDRNGVVLAGEAEITTVGVDLESVTDEAAVLNFFVERLGMDEDDVRERVYQDLPTSWFRPVAELPFDTPDEVIGEFERLAADGIQLSRRMRRYYPNGDLGAHVIGYLQEINADELAKFYVEGYRAGDVVGRDGIELSFERILAGRRGGSLLIVDPLGRPVREIAYRESTPGSSVRLTIDVRVQRLAEAALADQAGAVVAIDPRSGHVLAMASYPRVNPNTIVDGVTQEEYETYFFDERQPFINRASEQLYAPASTFKVVTLAAALEGGGYEISDRISCPAEWMKVGDQPLRNWKDDDQGRIALSQALAESCNTVFFDLGLSLDRLDETFLPTVASGFGFGQPTGVIGLDESAGLSPSPAWKSQQLNEAWFTGDTLNMSIGQGFVAATVLQVANAYSALATNGVVSTPVIVQSIEPRGAPPQVIERRPISVLPVSADKLEQLQAALRTTVSQPYGTGFYVFRGSVLRIAGKSGTTEDLVVDAEAVADIDESQSEGSGETNQSTQEAATQQDGQQSDADQSERYSTHAWFSAWANFEDPRLVVTVVLDDGQSGSDDAGPIVRRVLEGAILNNWVP